MKENKITCEFWLPYIVQPEGTNHFKYGENKNLIEIKHQKSPVLKTILTGIHQDTVNEIEIIGPKEIFQGISKISVTMPLDNINELNHGFTDKNLRNKIVDILNEYQYRYLYISQKYWLNVISADHFVNMNYSTPKRKGYSSDWGGSKRNLLEFREDDKVLSDFSDYIEKDNELPIQYHFLIDAKRHYLTGEYYLMYVETVIAFEALVNKAYNKISSIYERGMFKEGKLQGQMSHLLHEYCRWKDNDIENVIEICLRRQQVVHDNRRIFPFEEAYSHLIIGERAITNITDWIARAKSENIIN